MSSVDVARQLWGRCQVEGSRKKIAVTLVGEVAVHPGIAAWKHETSPLSPPQRKEGPRI